LITAVGVLPKVEAADEQTMARKLSILLFIERPTTAAKNNPHHAQALIAA
jgi:hypothetical protein